MARLLAAAAVLLSPAGAVTLTGSQSVRGDATLEYGSNPIRKVVTLLQAMQKKVEAEGEKEADLFQKFECYCSTGSGKLEKSVAEAQAKVPAVSSEIEEKEAAKAQMDEDLKQHQADRSAAKDAIADATAIREKEAAAYAKEKGEYDSNIEALVKAISAITRGMGGGFLQTSAAQVVKKLVSSQDMNDADRQELMAFFESKGSEDYAPKSGEITGILEQIKEDMEKSVSDATATEESAAKSFEELKAAKTKEIEALTHSIETKSQRTGDLAVEIVQAKNDLSDTQKALLEDQKFLADLAANCDSKKAEWAERTKTRQEELVAISETIAMLNSDGALDMFKKTLPSAASSSLMQVVSIREQALSVLKKNQKPGSHPDFDFIALAIQGKKVGFDKVLKMIDELVANLKVEQEEDDKKKDYCTVELDGADDKKKAQERTLADHETAIAEAEAGVAALKDEIEALTAGIADLDQSVVEASSQRKQEHAEYMELISSNSAAKDVLGMAINRLNQFYNPKLHIPVTAAPAAFVQISAQRDDPGPAPETFDEYSSKSEETNGVVGMINTLIKDLDKEMTEAEANEENSQKAYAQAMQDASDKKAADTESLTGKTAAKAAMETELEDHTEGKASTDKELMATAQYIQALHSECDWLQQYYDVRKEARASEVDSLKNAKAVLSGADYSLLEREELKKAKFLMPRA